MTNQMYETDDIVYQDGQWKIIHLDIHEYEKLEKEHDLTREQLFG
jgi:hypothetical protein